MSVQKGYKVTEVGVIPEEWRVSKLSLVTEKIGDGLHGTPVYADDTDMFFVNGNNLTNGKITIREQSKSVSISEFEKYKIILNKNTVLISLNGTIGNLAFYRNEKVILGKSAGYLIVDNKTNSIFIYYYLSSSDARKYYMDSVTGTSINNLSLASLRNMMLPLPSLTEQQKIADILSTVDEYIIDTENLLDKTQVLKKGMMNHLLTKGIGHSEFKDTEIGEIPVEWDVTELSKIAQLIMGQSPSSEFYNNNGEGLPFYQGKSEFGEKSPTTKTWCSAPIKRAPTGSILISVRAPVGAVNLNTEESCIGRGLAAIVARYGHSTMYIYYCLQNNKDGFEKVSQGSTFTAINSGDLSNFKIAKPSVDEQHHIASILNTIDDQIDVHQSKLTSLTKLKSALMQQLLTGKIRVKV